MMTERRGIQLFPIFLCTISVIVTSHPVSDQVTQHFSRSRPGTVPRIPASIFSRLSDLGTVGDLLKHSHQERENSDQRSENSDQERENNDQGKENGQQGRESSDHGRINGDKGRLNSDQDTGKKKAGITKQINGAQNSYCNSWA